MLQIVCNQYGARSHRSAKHDEQRNWVPAEQYFEPPPPTHYRQLVENGKPVPLSDQLRKVPERDLIEDWIRVGRGEFL
jgi:hypothetical protein